MSITTGRGRLACVAAGAVALVLACGVARAETRARAATSQTSAAAKPEGRVSKFEARRIRHKCHDRANEKGLKGSERDAFVAKCYFGRISHPGVRRECVRQGEAKGLDKIPLRDFVRECVKERVRPREQHEKPQEKKD